MCVIINHISCIINEGVAWYMMCVFIINIWAPSLYGLYRTNIIELVLWFCLEGGGGHVNSALDLGGSPEFCVGLAPIFHPPPQHFSNEHSLNTINKHVRWSAIALCNGLVNVKHLHFRYLSLRLPSTGLTPTLWCVFSTYFCVLPFQY